jgi:1-deoxy-D-xylulose-5-phosphate synthase
LRPINVKKSYGKIDTKANKSSILARIKGPVDLKALNASEIEILVQELRDTIITTVSCTGGHLASNLGTIELTVALHRVFDSPKDAIVFDVGHQCYTHKLLTGRFNRFGTLRQAEGLSGFPNRSESVYDIFNTGHASTAISGALGLLLGNQLQDISTHVVAVIGDGALTGGLAYEALSHAGHLQVPLIIILNDNAMSISPNVGALSHYLSRLSMKRHYQLLRQALDSTLQHIPILFRLMERIKRAIKAVVYVDNFFVDLGFEYVGPIEGHSVAKLEHVFRDVRDLGRPVVVHVLSKKGKGYSYAEQDPGTYHSVGVFSVTEGIKTGYHREQTFTDVFGTVLTAEGRSDPHIVAITAAMEKGTGLSGFFQQFPKRFFDVGIAEEHAVTFAAGLAIRGLRPVVAIYSTFIQRAVDQIIHDVALQKLPVIFCVDRAGLVSDDGETHQGLYDIALFRCIPSFIILAPAGKTELTLMLRYALHQTERPVMIRYPKSTCLTEIPICSTPLVEGRGIFIRKNGTSICIAFTGSLYQQMIEVAKQIETIDLYNIRFIKPVDEQYLIQWVSCYKTLVLIEEGIQTGGFGEYVAELMQRYQCQTHVVIMAISGTKPALGKRDELLRFNALDSTSITQNILKILNN